MTVRSLCHAPAN